MKNMNLSAKELSEKSVLDIGSGNGITTYKLAPHVKTIYGLEPDKNSLKKSRLLNRKFDIIRFRNSLQFNGSHLCIKKIIRIDKN